MQTRFIRSSYWGKWSLVLTERHIGQRMRTMAAITGREPGYSTIEIDLEPVNGWGRCGEEQIARMKRINVRRHCTERSDKDVYTAELPLQVRLSLAEHLGANLTEWLLDPKTEILGLIDWDRYDAISNGGAGLLDCVHPHLAQLIPGEGPSDTFGRIADALAYGLKAA